MHYIILNYEKWISLIETSRYEIQSVGEEVSSSWKNVTLALNDSEAKRWKLLDAGGVRWMAKWAFSICGFYFFHWNKVQDYLVRMTSDMTEEDDTMYAIEAEEKAVLACVNSVCGYIQMLN